MDDDITEKELSFLREMDILRMTDAEKEKVIVSVSEKECWEIFKHQVNLDSSPGPDGCIIYCLEKSLFLRDFL